MPVGTVAEAQAIARDVATVLDGLAFDLDQRADRALRAESIASAIALRQRVEELTRQAQRLRDV